MSDDINREILAELRRVRSLVRWALWLLLLVLIVSVLAFPAIRRSRSTSAATSWESVRSAMGQQDFRRALAEAQILVAGQPKYYYGQAYLGAIYLALGDVTNAETHYSQAYELFPNEQSEKDLAAVRKRMAEQQPMRLLSK
jgi:cytochrome c-type biogenesis protein CcmH/NrfG